MVADMDRSLGFYRDRLGLSIVGESRTSLIGAGRRVQLQYGPSRIKLVEMDYPPSAQGPLGIPAALGYRYITLLVADIHAVMQRMERNDVPITIPTTRLGNDAQIAMIQDPDGNIVEFVQEANSPISTEH
jgi:glyoxylase I family protein